MFTLRRKNISEISLSCPAHLYYALYLTRYHTDLRKVLAHVVSSFVISSGLYFLVDYVTHYGTSFPSNTRPGSGSSSTEAQLAITTTHDCQLIGHMDPPVPNQSRARVVDRVEVTCSQEMRRMTLVYRIGIAARFRFHNVKPAKNGSKCEFSAADVSGRLAYRCLRIKGWRKLAPIAPKRHAGQAIPHDQALRCLVVCA